MTQQLPHPFRIILHMGKHDIQLLQQIIIPVTMWHVNRQHSHHQLCSFYVTFYVIKIWPHASFCERHPPPQNRREWYHMHHYQPNSHVGNTIAHLQIGVCNPRYTYCHYQGIWACPKPHRPVTRTREGGASTMVEFVGCTATKRARIVNVGQWSWVRRPCGFLGYGADFVTVLGVSQARSPCGI